MKDQVYISNLKVTSDIHVVDTGSLCSIGPVRKLNLTHRIAHPSETVTSERTDLRSVSLT